ncbi:hypothetical protein CROQUDRAFT_658725 [Cronartium quercuum f. sp. fusiforme G11]|uniref:OTU domain-containing protein n=1 Tax=Cronartium quercuum f. sp. fusiforme G11 TaxID=708437 RepID=A0A9P6NKU7_9BASI|nr:hypothetical protein CROQUDRAFT_658725 [Cronartium quercuum f. sp. fusiforme G11]
MSLSATNSINPSDVLYRPKPSKKKLTRARKPNKKPKAGKQQPIGELQSNEALESVDDEDLIDRLLGGVEVGDEATDTQPLKSAVDSTDSNTGLTQKIEHLKEDVKEVAHTIATTIAHPMTAPGTKQHRNRQKDRLARRQAAEETVRENARLEAESLGPNANERKKESEAMEDAFQALGLRMVEMNPDGHCLFSAIADQLNLHKVALIETEVHTYQTCRTMAAEYMKMNRDEFVHYLPAADDGIGEGLMSDQQYAQHCDQVRDSAQWGGEPEILALSKVFKFPIHVVQASTSVLKIGEEDYGALRAGKALTISYHRKSYGLGEHYNSLRPR